MKRLGWYGLIFLLALVFLSVAPSANVAFAAGDLSDAPVMIMDATTSGRDITVDAVLKQNTGILGLSLEIVYDESAMTLTNVERGDALSSLDFVTTNVNTEKGYSVTPFKIIMEGEKNDASTGTVIRMHFTVKDSAEDGEYVVTLKKSGNKPVTYLSRAQVEVKNILIGDTKINVEGSIPEVVEEETGGVNKVALIVSLSVVGVLVPTIVAVTFIALKKKGKKGKESGKQ